MFRSVSTIVLLLALTGCVALAEGGVLEAGAADGLAARTLAADASAGAATSANTPLFVDGAIELGQAGSLREAFADLSTNQGALIIRNGAIEMGSQEIASLRGAQLFARGRLVGYLEQGTLVDELSGARVGKLHGLISRGQGVIRFASGNEIAASRSMSVQIIEQTEGGYLVRLPTGEEATLIGPLLAVALLPAISDRHCKRVNQDGFAIRRSGEVIPFDHCDEGSSTFRFLRGSELAIVDRSELSAVFYSHLTRSGNAVPVVGGQRDGSKDWHATALDGPEAAPILNLSGRWTDDGNCDKPTEFDQDGHFLTPDGSTGLWNLDGDRLTLTGNSILRFQVRPIDQNTVTIVHEDGSLGHSTRC